MSKENEKNLIEYLKEVEQLDSEFINLFYNIYLVGVYLLYECDHLLSDNLIPFEYEKMDIFDTFKLVKEFLNEIEPNYVKKFDRAMIDGTFDIFHIENLNESDNRVDSPINIEQGKSRGINVPIYNTISDGASILHEFFHYINTAKDSMCRSIYTELISFYMELRYYLFLYKKGYSIQNYYKCVYEIIFDIVKNSANNACYCSIILETFYHTGTINKENIKFIDKNCEIDDENIDDLIEFTESENFMDDIFEFENYVSYLLGGIIVIKLIDEPKLSDQKILYLNENFSNLSINKVFDLLQFDINNPMPFIYKCADTIRKLEGVISESNSNIGPNWSRKN